MDCENQTPFPAMLLTTVIDETRMAAAMIVRVTYEVREGNLVPSNEQPWIVSIEPWDSPLGPFEADQPFRKGGVDLFVAGSACTPGQQAQPQLEVSVAVGGFRASAIVFGARFWREKGVGRGLVPSEPIPFVTLPLTAENAFGGHVVVDGLVSPHPDNPKGIGLYVDEASAVNQPLPRIEDPQALISKWSDRPDPVLFGVCPLQSGQRLRSAVEIVEGRLERVSSRLFNMAYPRMVAPRVEPGDHIVLAGLTHEGPIAIKVPPSHLAVKVMLGEKTVERTPSIEEVGVDVPASKVFIGYRYPFRYKVVPHQRRLCTLESREG
jgi:hypothetical protein